MARRRATLALALLLALVLVPAADAAFSARVTGKDTVRFTGDDASDTLVLSVRPEGQLAHNRGVEHGLLGPTDMDTRVGLQELYPERDDITVEVVGGGGSDGAVLSGEEFDLPVFYLLTRGAISRDAGDGQVFVKLARDVETSGVRGGGGADSIAVFGLLNASVDGGGGADELVVRDLLDVGARYDLGPTALSRPGATLAHTGIEGLSLLLGDGSDGLTVAPGAPPALVRGGKGDDVLDATAATAGVQLLGEAGADALAGGQSTDVLDAGPGDDRVTANDGLAERINCGDGIDRVVADDRDSDITNCEGVERRQPVSAGSGGSGLDPAPGSGGGPGGDPGPQDDGVAPVLRSLRLDLTRIRTRPRATPTRIRFVVSEPSRVTVTLHRCAGRRDSCRTLRRAGTLSRPAITGANSIRFGGRIGGRRLRSGTYRLTVVATDAGGLRSIPRRAVLRVRR